MAGLVPKSIQSSRNPAKLQHLAKRVGQKSATEPFLFTLLAYWEGASMLFSDSIRMAVAASGLGHAEWSSRKRFESVRDSAMTAFPTVVPSRRCVWRSLVVSLVGVGGFFVGWSTAIWHSACPLECWRYEPAVDVLSQGAYLTHEAAIHDLEDLYYSPFDSSEWRAYALDKYLEALQRIRRIMYSRSKESSLDRILKRSAGIGDRPFPLMAGIFSRLRDNDDVAVQESDETLVFGIDWVECGSDVDGLYFFLPETGRRYVYPGAVYYPELIRAAYRGRWQVRDDRARIRLGGKTAEVIRESSEGQEALIEVPVTLIDGSEGPLQVGLLFSNGQQSSTVDVWIAPDLDYAQPP